MRYVQRVCMRYCCQSWIRDRRDWWFMFPKSWRESWRAVQCAFKWHRPPPSQVQTSSTPPWSPLHYVVKGAIYIWMLFQIQKSGCLICGLRTHEAYYYRWRLRESEYGQQFWYLISHHTMCLYVTQTREMRTAQNMRDRGTQVAKGGGGWRQRKCATREGSQSAKRRSQESVNGKPLLLS